jgi:predicted Ser/Thr protein kinase
MRATMMAMATPAPLLPGDPRWLGAYELVGRIGQGGQGTVYLGRKPSGEPVAVKLLRAEWTREPAARARFAREVAAAQRVAPFCTARILDARVEGDEPFVISEFIDGPSLHDVVTADGPVTGSALERLAVGTATALSAIHQAGVIHRDFKPGNVLLGPDGPRVIDFGIARSVDATTTVTSQPFGTPGYMAPEVVRGQPAGPPADVFAWAATITFAATGTPPFHAPNVAAIIHQLTQGEPDLGTLTGPLRGIVAGCLAKDPRARPTALDLLMRLLQHSGQGEPVPGIHAARAAPSRSAPATGESVPLSRSVGGGGAVISPPRQEAPAAWPTDRMARAGPVPVVGPAPGREQGRSGGRPWPGPPPRPGPGGRGAAGWVIVIAGVVALGIAGGLLLPVLLAGRTPASPPRPGLSASAPPRRAGHHGSPSAGPAAARPTASPATGRPAADAIPIRFAGTWRGTADQPDGTVTRWAAVLRLPAGSAAGTFTITSIPCYATVTVTDVTRTLLVLRESVGPGSAGTCAPSGYITLERTGLDRAALRWQDASDQANTAAGIFARL